MTNATKVQANADARIVDRGYQHYTGTRLGPNHGFWVMLRAAMRRILGIRRPTRAKVLPWLLIVAAYAPVIIILGVRLLIPGSGRAPLPGYSFIISNSISVILFVLFAGLIAPDLLCLDRRERVLSLLFAAPITRLSYVAAQVAALTIVMLLLTLGPALLLYGGNIALADAAGTYVRDHLEDLLHVLASGGLLALYYSAVSLAIASFTDRRPYASGIFLGLMLVSGVVANVLLRVSRGASGASAGQDWFALLDLVYTPLRVVRRLFGAPLYPNLGGPSIGGAVAGITIVSLALIVWRYLRLRD